MRFYILVLLLGLATLKINAEEPHHEQPDDELYSHVDNFERQGMPAERWDIRPRTGFGIESSKQLNAVGYHGPNTLGASSPLQDMEFSLWFLYRDLRPFEEIPVGEQEFDIVLRWCKDSTGMVWLRLSPRGLRLMSTDGAETRTLAVAGMEFEAGAIVNLDTLSMQFTPGSWYNLRIRIVGNQVRVWLRDDDGKWGTPVLTVLELPHNITSTAYAFTAHPTARYRLANFRMRAFEGDISRDIEDLDNEKLIIN